MTNSVLIKRIGVSLCLTSPRSKVRVCDNEGNHIAKPATEGKYLEGYSAEWMITNEEVIELARIFLTQAEIEVVIEELQQITVFLRESEYYVRKATKTKLDTNYSEFEVFEYKEKFYSFERDISSNIRVRITFKMGDFTLAAHMFVLFPFSNSHMILTNRGGAIQRGCDLGSGASLTWLPISKQVTEIIQTLAHSSAQHRNDLVNLLAPLLK